MPDLLRARAEILFDLAERIRPVLKGRDDLDTEIGREVAKAFGWPAAREPGFQRERDIGNPDVLSACEIPLGPR